MKLMKSIVLLGAALVISGTMSAICSINGGSFYCPNTSLAGQVKAKKAFFSGNINHNAGNYKAYADPLEADFEFTQKSTAQNIVTNSAKVIISDSSLANLTVRAAQEITPVVVLSNAAIAGSITFEGKSGVVVVLAGNFDASKIINGHIVTELEAQGLYQAAFKMAEVDTQSNPTTSVLDTKSDEPKFMDVVIGGATLIVIIGVIWYIKNKLTPRATMSDAAPHAESSSLVQRADAFAAGGGGASSIVRSAVAPLQGAATRPAEVVYQRATSQRPPEKADALVACSTLFNRSSELVKEFASGFASKLFFNHQTSASESDIVRALLLLDPAAIAAIRDHGFDVCSYGCTWSSSGFGLKNFTGITATVKSAEEIAKIGVEPRVKLTEAAALHQCVSLFGTPEISSDDIKAFAEDFKNNLFFSSKHIRTELRVVLQSLLQFDPQAIEAIKARGFDACDYAYVSKEERMGNVLIRIIATVKAV